MQSEHVLVFSILRTQIHNRNLTEVTMKLLVSHIDHNFTLFFLFSLFLEHQC